MSGLDYTIILLALVVLINIVQIWALWNAVTRLRDTIKTIANAVYGRFGR